MPQTSDEFFVLQKQILGQIGQLLLLQMQKATSSCFRGLCPRPQLLVRAPRSSPCGPQTLILEARSANGCEL